MSKLNQKMSVKYPLTLSSDRVDFKDDMQMAHVIIKFKLKKYFNHRK